MGILVIGPCFVDIKGFPHGGYIPDGRNAGWVEYVHGGVSRNVVEDIANLELRPTYLSIVDESAMGRDVLSRLAKHKVNVEHILHRAGGMGTWLAVFDEKGDVAGSISQRPNMEPLLEVLKEKGDALFEQCESVVIEVDMNRRIVKEVVRLAKRHGKKLFGVVSNMSIAADRRDFLQHFDCFVCNQQEAGIFFADDFSGSNPEVLRRTLSEKVRYARIPAMVVTLGGLGSVYADLQGDSGYCPAQSVRVKDTTGAGDSFCAGVSVGLTYGKTLREAVELGTRLAASVIISLENVCPRYRPRELGLDVDILDETAPATL